MQPILIASTTTLLNCMCLMFVVAHLFAPGKPVGDVEVYHVVGAEIRIAPSHGVERGRVAVGVRLARHEVYVGAPQYR